VAFVQRLQFAGGQQVHPPQQPEAASHDVRPLLEVFGGVVIAQFGERGPGFRSVALAEGPFAVLDPPLEVQPGPVLVVVLHAERLHCGGLGSP